MVLAVIAALFVAPSADEPRMEVRPVPSPATGQSGQPQLSINGNRAILSWIEERGSRATLMFADRTASGWSQPKPVAWGDDWFVNWADVPSVVRLESGTLAAHWLQKSAPDSYAYDVRLSFSRDEGKTWSASSTPHHDRTETEHGFASLFQRPGAGLGLVWLDGRNTATEPDFNMAVRAAAFDGSGKQVSETLVDPRVCECCPTAVAVTSEGPIAAYRDRSSDEDEVRDIHVTRLLNGRWTPSRAVHNDGWKIPACPVNGPALAARGRQVAIAWFTVKGEQGRTFVAFSSDAGATFGPPIRLDDEGSLGRVDIDLLDDGSAVATWVEFAEQRAQFRVRRVSTDGTRPPATTISGIDGSRASGYPRLARRGDELLFAWTESADEVLRVKTAAARLTTSTLPTR
jgi:hypothetical protein